MLKRQAGFMLLGASVNLLLVTILIITVLGHFINSIAIQSKIREQERAAFLAAEYLLTGDSSDPLFVLLEENRAIDSWLVTREIKVYKNDKLLFTAVTLASNK